MTQARLILACVAPGLLAACSPYLPRYAPAVEAAETGFYENIDTPRLALLEYRLGKYFAQDDRPYEVVCASDEKPSVVNGKTERAPLDPEVELALIKRFPDLSPFTRCKQQGIDIVAADTGVAAAIFDVNEFSCEARDNCVGWGGHYANGQHGWSYYRLTYKQGSWRIQPEDLGIVLTATDSTQQPPPPETELPTLGSYTTELPDTPGMALLQILLDDQFANPDRYATTCATIVTDNARSEALPEEVELALIARYPELAPFARCVWKDDAMVVDAITGERAVIYSVRRIACPSPAECTAWGGWITANLGAEAWEYRLRRVDGKWLAERTGNGVIS